MIRRFFSFIFGHIWSLFINGLLTLLPITITLGLFSFTFRLIKGWLAPLRDFQDQVPYLKDIPHAEIILAFAVIFIAGVVLKSFIIRSVVEVFEMLVEQVPLVRPVYTGIKQLVTAFSPKDTMTFKQVVLVEFPRNGLYSIGFQTTQMAKELAPDPEHVFYNIFIPTTPNPTTGYFVVVKKQDFKPIDLTTQEAMALIISGGIVQPKRYPHK
jgi:uncharacterized membrane protein